MAATLTSPIELETVRPDEGAVIAEFIAYLKDASARRYPTGPMLRFNQGRQTACVQAEFTVLEEIAPELRVGLFSEPRTYSAWIRFGNAESKSDREKDVRGMAIKVTGVQKQNLTAGVTAQDFVLSSRPVMVAGTAHGFLDLLQALEAGGLRLLSYALSHPRALRNGLVARSNHSCHLDIPYWSATPYLFGQGRAVKYKVRPCSEITSALPRRLSDGYLHEAMRVHLTKADACFDFMVQFRTDPRTMPIEDASVEWSERTSAFRTVARVRIPKQDIADPAHARLCEESRFDPWHSLPEHRPLGDMNRARREIYPALAEFRSQHRTRVPSPSPR